MKIKQPLTPQKATTKDQRGGASVKYKNKLKALYLQFISRCACAHGAKRVDLWTKFYNKIMRARRKHMFVCLHPWQVNPSCGCGQQWKSVRFH